MGRKHEGLPGLFAAIAAYCPTDARPAKLPFAFIAAHPSARLVAEFREAQRVAFFQFTGVDGGTGRRPQQQQQRRRHGTAALLLATSTTPLSRLRELFTPHRDGRHEKSGLRSVLESVPKALSHIQLADVYNSYKETDDDTDDSSSVSGGEGDAGERRQTARTHKRQKSRPRLSVRSQLACCGTTVGGVTTVLVSRRDLRAKALTAPCKARKRLPKEQRNAGKGEPAVGIDAIRHDIASGQTLREWLREAKAYRDEKEQKKKSGRGRFTGLSTHLLEVLEPHPRRFLFPSTTVAPSALSLTEAVVFHDGQAAGLVVDDHRQKLKTAMSTMIASQFLSAEDRSLRDEEEDVMLRLLYISSSGSGGSPLADVVLGVSRWWLQRPIKPSELPFPKAESVCPSLNIKFVSDVFVASSWWRCVLPLWRALSSVALFVWGMAVQWLLGGPAAPPGAEKLPQPPRACERSSSRLPCSLQEMQRLGESFSFPSAAATTGGVTVPPILQSLDASRTSITGSHLLALARGAEAAPHKGFLRSLDLASCPKLHVHLKAPPVKAAQNDETDLASLDRLCSASDAGLALGKLSFLGGLTWLQLAGSSFNQAAVDSLGLYSLLHEALSFFTPASSSSPLSATTTPRATSSLLAVNMSSNREVSSLNGFAFVPSLLQLLVPFSDVNDSHVEGLDGHNFLMKLAGAVAQGREEAALSTPTLGFLSRLSRVRAATHGPEPTQDIAAELARRFSSHFYHLDFTFSVGLTDVRELLHTQRLLQFLNLSQTHVYGAGLGADVRPAGHEDVSDTGFLCPLHTFTFLSRDDDAYPCCYSSSSDQEQPFPSPLRVLLCDPCDHIDTLGGLTPSLFPNLEKLYLRSGSLSEEGIAAAFHGHASSSSPVGFPPFPSLKLLDLSYCDKVHEVGILSRFPTLHTLNLDSTEVTPEGLRHLSTPHSTLKVLSLRYCPEVRRVLGKAADDAERLRRFRERICHIPSLEAVIVETAE